MIPIDFAYYKPTSAAEALDTFDELRAEGKDPLYYAGGTEILCAARLHQVRTEAVIDLKGVPECFVHGRSGDEITFGACLTLTEITEANLWPLLSDAAGRVADHTTRGKITLGGNIAGEIRYREAVLPFLLADAQAVIYGRDGMRHAPLETVFDGQLGLETGEFLVQLVVDAHYTDVPYVCVKKTRLDWIDYPLLTAAAIRKGDRMRIAFSGLCDKPFRSARIENDLNDDGLPPEEKVERAVRHVPAPILDDLHGSAGYRKFVLKNTVEDILTALGG